MSYVIRLIDIPGGTMRGDKPIPVANQYLADFDPDGNDGRGYARWTLGVAQAMRFASREAAHACWAMQSRVHPLRDDGMPNRPLTAFTVMIEAEE